MGLTVCHLCRLCHESYPARPGASQTHTPHCVVGTAKAAAGDAGLDTHHGDGAISAAAGGQRAAGKHFPEHTNYTSGWKQVNGCWCSTACTGFGAVEVRGMLRSYRAKSRQYCHWLPSHPPGRAYCALLLLDRVLLCVKNIAVMRQQTLQLYTADLLYHRQAMSKAQSGMSRL
jgi:hypothetical protein